MPAATGVPSAKERAVTTVHRRTVTGAMEARAAEVVSVGAVRVGLAVDFRLVAEALRRLAARTDRPVRPERRAA